MPKKNSGTVTFRRVYVNELPDEEEDYHVYTMRQGIFEDGVNSAEKALIKLRIPEGKSVHVELDRLGDDCQPVFKVFCEDPDLRNQVIELLNKS